MQLEPMLANEASRKAFAEAKGYQAVAQILLRKQEMVISGAISAINQLSLHGTLKLTSLSTLFSHFIM